MQQYILTSSGEDEEQFYGDALIRLRGAISEFLSCLDMMREYQKAKGDRDPVASWQARVKSAKSMREKLQRQNLPVTTQSATTEVFDAAGVRLICPFVEDIYQTAEMIRNIPGVVVHKEKDYVQNPKPNGYRSYHMILSMPLRFLEQEASCYLEVQIRTIAMDCWASIEHGLKYKHSIQNQEMIVAELKRCADEIASTDLSLQTIRQLIAESE